MTSTPFPLVSYTYSPIKKEEEGYLVIVFSAKKDTPEAKEVNKKIKALQGKISSPVFNGVVVTEIEVVDPEKVYGFKVTENTVSLGLCIHIKEY